MIDRSTLGGWLGVRCWGALPLGALFVKQRERERGEEENLLGLHVEVQLATGRRT
jgi:hypothetical protein